MHYHCLLPTKQHQRNYIQLNTFSNYHNTFLLHNTVHCTSKQGKPASSCYPTLRANLLVFLMPWYPTLRTNLLVFLLPCYPTLRANLLVFLMPCYPTLRANLLVFLLPCYPTLRANLLVFLMSSLCLGTQH